jgi:cell pole-organizing protein PopZ
MSQAAKSQEPSMEEILASIRRIIADDDAAKPPAKPPAAAAPPPRPAQPAPRPAAAAPPPRPAAPAPRPPAPPAPAPVSGQDDIDAMFDTIEIKANGAAPAADILDLTEAMEAPPEPAPALRHIDGSHDVVYEEPAAPPPEPPEPPTVEEARRQFHQHTGPDRNLLSPSTTAAVDSAFNSLANTVLVQNSRTLDDLVREMLRPMLKAWLDDNLPNMVERMVRAEIERVSRGRG